MSELSPASEAAYFASIWQLSNPQMAKLEAAFNSFLKAGRAEPRSAFEAVRALIKPNTILTVSEIHLEQFTRREVFNALSHLTRTGELAHVSYGKYQSPPSTGSSP